MPLDRKQHNEHVVAFDKLVSPESVGFYLASTGQTHFLLLLPRVSDPKPTLVLGSPIAFTELSRKSSRYLSTLSLSLSLSLLTQHSNVVMSVTVDPPPDYYGENVQFLTLLEAMAYLQLLFPIIIQLMH